MGLKIDLYDEDFLEFYGRLLGDGWLSKLKYKNRFFYWVGLSGHSIKDKKFLLETRDLIYKLFDRKATIKIRPRNSMEIIFGHKELIHFLNEKLEFPIGKKKNIKIYGEFCKKWKTIVPIIRGIFDTDGSLYFDKTPVGRPYPTISIQMKAPFLIHQIYDWLIRKGFKVRYRKDRNEIVLKGTKQLEKWMEEIGSNNERRLSPWRNWITQQPPKL